jgi:hypothetical protein
MTQWYKPRQRGPHAINAGKGHYTCGNTSGTAIYPVGACADSCLGHDTAEGATRHYAEGLAAGEIREREDEQARHKCEVCGDWTQHRAMLWGNPFEREHAICATHDIRAHLRNAVFLRYKVTPQ